jgi:hypothetical protein
MATYSILPGDNYYTDLVTIIQLAPDQAQKNMLSFLEFGIPTGQYSVLTITRNSRIIQDCNKICTGRNNLDLVKCRQTDEAENHKKAVQQRASIKSTPRTSQSPSRRGSMSVSRLS